MSAEWGGGDVRRPLPPVFLGRGSTTGGFSGPERRCVCGAPWTMSWSDQGGEVYECAEHPGHPDHQQFAEILRGVPRQPPVVAPWAAEEEERPQSEEALKGCLGPWLGRERPSVASPPESRPGARHRRRGGQDRLQPGAGQLGEPIGATRAKCRSRTWTWL